MKSLDLLCNYFTSFFIYFCYTTFLSIIINYVTEIRKIYKSFKIDNKKRLVFSAIGKGYKNRINLI